MKGPTKRQLEVLRSIVTFMKGHGYPPGWRDIADAIGTVSTNGVNDHLAALHRKGLVRRERMVGRGNGRARHIGVTDAGMQALGYPPGTCVMCGRWDEAEAAE